MRWLLPAAAGLVLTAVPAERVARADDAAAARAAGITLGGMRSWSAPTHTRVVLDFSAAVTPVAPDSGAGRQLVVTFPADGVTLGTGVPPVLRVADGVLDSVRAVAGGGGVRCEFWFADSLRFQVFTLRAEEDKPFRLVVDATRPGARAEQDRRLAGIAASKRQDRIRVVAVDAGHGGEDTGARGPRGVLEKNVVLGVARSLVAALNRLPGVKGVLVRDGDYFIPLRDRYRAAERMKADLFISIHANSSRRRGAGSGTEVYFLSLGGASDQATKDLADLENAADLVGGVPAQAEETLVNILYDVKRSSSLQQSQLLAETLLDHLTADRRLGQRGVKQAGFAVLKSVEFPSVLVETAFINNPAEARLLRSPEFQKKLGEQLAAGVRVYFERAGLSPTGSGASGPGADGAAGTR
jgi:N-acetylmuramoyl-L-alanine amidase